MTADEIIGASFGKNFGMRMIERERERTENQLHMEWHIYFLLCLVWLVICTDDQNISSAFFFSPNLINRAIDMWHLMKRFFMFMLCVDEMSFFFLYSFFFIVFSPLFFVFFTFVFVNDHHAANTLTVHIGASIDRDDSHSAEFQSS